MNRQDIEKLLGGYAAGTLTAQERDALFAAALEDQQLFESLAREEPLRELLADPAARGQLLESLGTAREPWYYRPLGLTPILATASAAVIVTAAVYWWAGRRQEPVQIAQVVPQTVVAPSQKPFVPPPLPRAAQPVLLKEPPPALPTPVYAPLPRVLAEVRTPPPQPITMQAASVRLPTAMQFRAEQKAAAALPVAFGVRYSIIKTLPTGEVTEVDAKQELDRNDEVQIRFQANETGYLYMLQRDPEKNWQPFTSQRIPPSTPVEVPPKDTVRADSTGTKEFFVVFSRQPLTNLNRVRALAVSSSAADKQQIFSLGGFGETRAVITTVSEPASQQVAFPITLKYK